MKDAFNFDKFASSATFKEVQMLMFESRRLPSMTSPDGTWLFLSSLEETVASDDVVLMRDQLQRIEDGISILKAEPNLNYSKISDYENDRVELEGRLEYL